MTNLKGTPIWYEYLADDADTAQRFYSNVLDWQVRGSGMAEIDYRLAAAPDGADVAGLFKRPEAMPGGATWIVYFATDDVDAAAAEATAAGGQVYMPPMDLEGVGRMAMLGDPQGHPFYVMRGASDESSTAFQQSPDATSGHAVWNELTAEDQDAAMVFYSRLLGLRHEGAMPMGPLGEYKFIQAGDAAGGAGECVALGASMNLPPNGRRGWLPYFLVDDVDAAVERLTSAGGTLVQGPDEIPGGDFAVIAEDPDGARFGFVGPRE